MSVFAKIQAQFLNAELRFQTARSSGPGGQHVNKVSSKVLLRFNIPQSTLLNDEEKAILLEKLANKCDQEGNLILQSQDTPSQLRNKEAVIRKFYSLLSQSLQKKKIRKASRPSKSAIEARLKAKKERSAKKQNRRRDW